MRTLYVATTNAGKLRDFQAAADAYAVAIEPLPGMDAISAPVEDASTFLENAYIKAIAYSLHLPGEMVVADDSGLEVDTLGGAPGVYSARYAARENFPNPHSLTPDDWNNACLLHQLGTTEQRNAHYRCVLALACDGEVILDAEGSVDGAILTAPRGSGGFGYDPLFLLPQLGLTMAEVAINEKLRFSHRGRALAALLTLLRTADSVPAGS